MTSNKMKRLS